MTYKGHLCLLWINIFYPANPLDGLMLEDIAAQSVNSVCRVNDDTPFKEAICYRPQIALLGVFRVYL